MLPVSFIVIINVRRNHYSSKWIHQWLNTRLKNGKPVNKIVLVANFLVSRVDTTVDATLEAHLDTEKANQLLGKEAKDTLKELDKLGVVTLQP